MSGFRKVIHWFKRDLRLTDNTALLAAVAESREVIPVYIVSDWEGSHQWTGAKRQWFLSGCLESLRANLRNVGGELYFRHGQGEAALAQLIDETGAEAVYVNRDPDPFGKEMERRVAGLCREKGVAYKDFKDTVLHEGEEALTGSGTPYRVFTPYFRQWIDLAKERPKGGVKQLNTPDGISPGKCPTLETWGLKLNRPPEFIPGERAGRDRMKKAVREMLGSYCETRDIPGLDATSRLGADLRYGTISIRELFDRVEKARLGADRKEVRQSLGEYQRQLAWREFFMAVLHHYPEVLDHELNPVWRGVPWDDPDEDGKLAKWQQGKTGFPIVDAGMRQLVETGFMHNRVRMIVAMFLTKDLHLDWRLGEAFFLRHLLDGEIASNNGGWQWSAGTGADAAPYFRIQNPWTQTTRFDPEGAYIRRWVPELAGVEGKRLGKAPVSGESVAPGYPAPIVDHREAREETLRRFKAHREAMGN